MFIFKKRKKELNISDALRKKEVTLTIQGKDITIRAFQLEKALEYIEVSQFAKELIASAPQTIEGLKKFKEKLMAKIPYIVFFCLDKQADGIDIKNLTVAEFMDIVLATWSANDMDLITQNFQVAMPLTLKAMQASASSPK